MSEQQSWFSSDFHLWHRNIISIGQGRPWDTVEEMNEAIIANWNAHVRPGDQGYLLGDLIFGNVERAAGILDRLNGNLHVVRGNHDQTIDKVARRYPNLLASYRSYKEIKVRGQRIVLFHFPILSWHEMHHGSWHLHGHCHGTSTYQNGRMLDVGVDCHNYQPISFDEVAALMAPKVPRYHDHHQPDKEPS